MATAHDGDAFEEAIERGAEALRANRLADAVSALRSALAASPDNTRALALLGLAHFRNNALDMARPIYEDLVERMPTDASHRLNLGLVYLKLGDADHAISSLEASRALDPGQGRAISYLGLAYARAGRYAEAYRSFLLANQNDLAVEIQDNLTAAERDGIHSQLGRTPTGPLGGAAPAPVVSRTISEPRTKPPSAPPQNKAPTTSRDVTAKAAAAKAIVAAESPTPTPGEAPTAPTASDDTATPRLTESMQFVLGRGDSARHRGGDISAAVAAAAPAGAATTAAATTTAIPLSQLATTELVRPQDHESSFELSTGGELVLRVGDRVLTRLDGVYAISGDLGFEPAMRRARGHNTDEPFDYGGTRLYVVSGTGFLVALPGDRTFVSITLDDDILYLREDLVYAFEATLRWETGNVPGLRGRFPVVQFRGDGAVALRLPKPLVRVRLPSQGVLRVDSGKLAGWIGRVIPRAIAAPVGASKSAPADAPAVDAPWVECTGEGIVLLDPSGSPLAPPPPEPVVEVAPPPRSEPAALDMGADPIADPIADPMADDGDPMGDPFADSPVEAAADSAPTSPTRVPPPVSPGQTAVAALLGKIDDDHI